MTARHVAKWHIIRAAIPAFPKELTDLVMSFLPLPIMFQRADHGRFVRSHERGVDCTARELWMAPSYLRLIAAKPIRMTDSKWSVRITSAEHWTAGLVRTNRAGKRINEYALAADGSAFTHTTWGTVASELRRLLVPLAYKLVFSFNHDTSSVSAVVQSVTCICRVCPSNGHKELCRQSSNYDIGVLYRDIPNFGDLTPMVCIWNTPPALVEISSEDN